MKLFKLLCIILALTVTLSFVACGSKGDNGDNGDNPGDVEGGGNGEDTGEGDNGDNDGNTDDDITDDGGDKEDNGGDSDNQGGNSGSTPEIPDDTDTPTLPEGGNGNEGSGDGNEGNGDGTGGDHFYHQLADEPDMNKTMALFLSRGRNETVSDQWQSQILLRILLRARVIYVSAMPSAMVEAMHMIPADSLEDALVKAKALTGKENPTITAIPDGVSVVVKQVNV